MLAAIRRAVHLGGGVFGGKYPTSNIARSSSDSDRTACVFRHHVRGRVLAAVDVIVEQRLHLGHALADFPCWIVDHRWPLKLVSF